MSRFRLALLLCGILAIVGYYLGQYKPFTGGFLIAIAEPHSPARNQLAQSYAIVGGIIGIIIGLLSGQKSTKNPASVNNKIAKDANDYVSPFDRRNLDKDILLDTGNPVTQSNMPLSIAEEDAIPTLSSPSEKSFEHQESKTILKEKNKLKVVVVVVGLFIVGLFAAIISVPRETDESLFKKGVEKYDEAMTSTKINKERLF